MKTQIRAGIVGASGYTGGELLRLIAGHPGVTAAWATSRQWKGRPVSDAFPSLEGFFPLVFDPPDPAAMPADLDAVFVALPHTEAMAVVPALLDRGVKVIDLSADYRLRDPAQYEEWYGTAHRSAGLLDEAVYGLPELYRDELRTARLAANPGCYPTATILALAPLARGGLISGGVVVDAKSGVSGAGRTPKTGTLFSEVHGGMSAYLPGRHRHIPEMLQELDRLSAAPLRLTFTPHLAPLVRGILATAYVDLAEGAALPDVERALLEAYAGEPFVQVTGTRLPSLKEVAGTNLCRIGCTVDPQGGRAVLVSVIDNLVKGAAGQALQNLNLMCGLDETAGLGAAALFP